MPDVPNVPGVPPLSSYSTENLSVASFDGITLPASQQQWGIFPSSGGTPLILADTVATFNFKKEWVISNFPIEKGSFESYDKVETPYEVVIRYAAGTDVDTRAAMLDSIRAAAGDNPQGSPPNIMLYDVAMPETIYLNGNVTLYDYQRESTRGLGILTVDVKVSEVRIAQGAAGTATQSPSGASSQPDGLVQSLVATTSQTNAANVLLGLLAI